MNKLPQIGGCHFVVRAQEFTTNPLEMSPFVRMVYGPLILRHIHTVDGRNPAKQLRLVVSPNFYQLLYIPGWCRISSINSMGPWEEFQEISQGLRHVWTQKTV